MQLTRQKHKPTRPLLNMAAMIDIVFLLLIFFMCTTTFRKPEKHLDSQIPETGIEGERPVEEFDPIRIQLKWAQGTLHLLCDSQLKAGFDELHAALLARRAIADVPVVIDGGGDVPFEHMVSALDSCHRAGLTRVAFAARGAVP